MSRRKKLENVSPTQHIGLMSFGLSCSRGVKGGRDDFLIVVFHNQQHPGLELMLWCRFGLGDFQICILIH